MTQLISPKRKLTPIGNYLRSYFAIYRLIQWMGQLGFEQNDPLWRDVCTGHLPFRH
jgi:hypothetical protein